MKILAKLLSSFIAVAALCVLVGYVGLDRMENAKEGLTVLSKETIPKLMYVNTIDLSLREVINSVRTMANPYAMDDEYFFNELQKDVAEGRKNYAEAREEFEKLTMNDEEIKLYKAVSDAIPPAVDYNNRIMALVEKAKTAAPEDREEYTERAYALISGSEGKVIDDLIERFEELLEFVQYHYGKEMTDGILNQVVLGRIAILVIGALSCIAAIILGAIQGTSISGKLGITVRIMDKIAHGDLSETLTIKTSDEFKQVAESLNNVEKNVKALVADTGDLVKNAIAGNLGYRAQAQSHEGEYRRVIEGINETLDAVVSPLNLAADYVDRIAQGNLPEKVMEVWSGDFNKIRNNLNLAIDSINALIEDSAQLTEAAVAGSLQVRADVSKHQGDYRKIIEGVNKTLDLVITPINEVIEVLKNLAEGDLTWRVAGDYRGDFDILKSALNESIEAIGDTLSQVNTAVEQVAEGSVQVSQASQALSQGATEQASSLEEITSSTTEISSQTRQNTDNALKMNSLAGEAQENAEKGNAQMKELVSAMSDINTSAESIKKVVNTIDDISFQINLLALNANVEAARAGKYGKGFAVVAEEVRNLAVRSASSVKDTTRMVDEAIGNIQRGNTLVSNTASQLDEIVIGSAQVSALAEEVATAGREQTQGLEQISLGLTQIDQVTQSNTASAEESASASEELSSQAQQVKAMLARFKLKDSGRDGGFAAPALSSRAGSRTAAAQPGFLNRTKPSPGAASASADQLRRNATPAAAAVKKTAARVVPSDIISLDDGNFGKF